MPVSVARHGSAPPLLARMHLIIAVRRQAREIGWEEPQIVETGHPAVLALTYGTDDPLLVVHNLSSEPAQATMEQLAAFHHQHDVLADRPYTPIEDLGKRIELGPYGYRWSRLRSRGDGEGREAKAATEALRDRPT